MKTTVQIILAVFLLVSLGQAKEMTFVIDDTGGRNVAKFSSKAPIETIVGTTNQVTGKITFDPDDLSKPAHGSVAVDIVSLNTGIKLRDEHMRGEDYLNTDTYPTATFVIDNPVIAKVKSLVPGETVAVEVKGKFTVHGVTKDITIKGNAGYFMENPALAKMGYPGDMFNFDGEFSINLSDYNIKRPQFLVMKLAEEVKIRINFTATTGR